jgi:hypothetical protein
VRQLPEARGLRRELADGDGEVAALHAGVEASADHGEGQGGAHELQRVEAAVVHERKRRRRGRKGVASESHDGKLTGGDEDDRFGLLTCR